MDGNIEELVLSGKLFNPPSRSTSPTRTPSPSSSPTRIAQWPTEENDGTYDYDSDAERRAAIEATIARQQQQDDSIGMGPGRTGVKGVIRDRKEADALSRAKKAQGVEALNRKMEKASLGGKTWGEEERERVAEKAREEGRSVGDVLARGEDTGVRARRGRFGHLREVGMQGYLQAIENEERHVWVVMHIYDPSLDRCATLDDTLSRLARLHPSTKFLRVRAGAIGFASSQPSAPAHSSSLHVPKQPFRLTRTPSRKILVPGRYPTEDEDDDDDDDDEFGSSGGEDDEWNDDKVDTDVLPTMLVYRGGELVHSWVRVDWEATLGVEELLKQYHILSETRASSGSHLDDEFDDDFDDGELVFGGSDDE